jgi:hypothetical protein
MTDAGVADVERSFKGSLFYWVPDLFPVIPWYSWPLGSPLVSLTMTDEGLSLKGPWPFLSRGWRGAYSDIERFDVTWLGVRLWFKRESPMTFRTSQQEDLVNALKSRQIQFGLPEREVG